MFCVTIALRLKYTELMSFVREIWQIRNTRVFAHGSFCDRFGMCILSRFNQLQTVWSDNTAPFLFLLSFFLILVAQLHNIKWTQTATQTNKKHTLHTFMSAPLAPLEQICILYILYIHYLLWFSGRKLWVKNASFPFLWLLYTFVPFTKTTQHKLFVTQPKVAY